MITPAPPLYTPDDLEAAIKADFAARGIAAAIEVGEWTPETKRGEPRVVIAAGDFEATEPQGHHQPGPQPLPGSTDEARPLLDFGAAFTLWVHAPGSGRTEATGAAARRATVELVRLTLAALRRVHAGPLRGPVRGRFLRPDEIGETPQAGAYAAYTLGSVAQFTVTMPTPIFDDPLTVGDALELVVATNAEQGGTLTPTETHPA